MGTQRLRWQPVSAACSIYLFRPMCCSVSDFHSAMHLYWHNYIAPYCDKNDSSKLMYVKGLYALKVQ